MMDNFWIRLKNTHTYKASFDLIGHSFVLHVDYNPRNKKRVISITDNDDIVYLQTCFIDKYENLRLNKNFEILGYTGAVSLLQYSPNIKSTDYLNWQNSYTLLFTVSEIEK